MFDSKITRCLTFDCKTVVTRQNALPPPADFVYLNRQNSVVYGVDGMPFLTAQMMTVNGTGSALYVGACTKRKFRSGSLPEFLHPAKCRDLIGQRERQWIVDK